MRDRKLSTCLLAILFFITTLTAFTQDISADIGPKPSIELHLENAPSDYFIVLLAPTQETRTESPLRLDQVNEDSVAAYCSQLAGRHSHPVRINRHSAEGRTVYDRRRIDRNENLRRNCPRIPRRKPTITEGAMSAARGRKEPSRTVTRSMKSSNREMRENEA